MGPRDPFGWYPESTPANLEKWKFPSCRPCNHAYGVLENDLLLRFGLCIGPEEALAAGIGEKALRSINPKYATNEKDRRARQARRDMVLREMHKLDSPDVEGIFPGFGARPNLEYDGYFGIGIPADSVMRYGEKVVRGVTYLRTERLIPASYRIEVRVKHDRDAADFLAAFKGKAMVVSRGPGVVVEHALALDDGISALFHVAIWGRYKIYAMVAQVDHEAWRG